MSQATAEITSEAIDAAPAEVEESATPAHLPRTLRITYAQAMLGSIYGASTGGMFLIGYALRLGASNVQIGMLSTVPMLCVVMQLLSAHWVEKGLSRRRLTAIAALLNAAGWAAVILIPYAAGSQPAIVQISLLIAIITFNMLFAHLANNARASWVGDLVPAKMRGRFFGQMAMYGGLVAMFFALIEGLFLDQVKTMGIAAFSLLFAFGMIFGLANAFLFWPQPDVPLDKHESGSFRSMSGETFRNRGLMAVMIFAIVWSMQGISGPFYPTYMLRDLKMPFVGVGIINAAFMVSVLLSSRFWGRVVDHYGCRPVLIGCALIFIPGTLTWMFMTTPARVYMTMIPVHLVVGAAAGGIGVALNTLLYKATPSAGRSVQLAIYSVVVTLIAAPMPTIGGFMPDVLKTLTLRLFGFAPDLRIVFFTQCFFVIAAVIAARRIHEPGSRRTMELVRGLPEQILQTVA